MTTTTELPPPRPPRPARLDPGVLAEAARALGMKEREIALVTDTEAGRVIQTVDGVAMIVVPADRPDAAGQTGVLHFPTPRHPASRNPRVGTYADPAGPAPAEVTEGWDLADLDQEARRVPVPPAVNVPGVGPSLLPWIGNDPVRARAAWLYMADRLRLPPASPTLRRNQHVARYRAIILASGWLDEREASRL